MSPRITNILLGVALLGCGIYAYQWHNQVQSLQANLDALNLERDRLNRRIAELKDTKPTPVEAVAEPQETEQPEDRGPGRPGFTPGENAGPPREGFRGGGGDGRARFMAMMENPEIQKLMSIQQKAALDSRFASLFKSLNLSPADLEKFKSLLVEKQNAVMDARAAARAQGLTGPESRGALRQVISAAQAEVDNTIRSTLGEAAFAQYQTYEQTLPERNLVTQLQQRLSYSSTPLTDVQTNQVVALLAANNPATTQKMLTSATTNITTVAGNGSRNGMTQFRNGGVTITDAVITGSQNILTSTQLSALTQLQQEQQAQAQLAAQLRAARQAANPKTNSGSAVPPTGKP